MSTKHMSYEDRQERIADLQIELHAALLAPILDDVTERFVALGDLSIPALRSVLRNAIIESIVAFDKARIESFQRVHES